jgi:GMP synthase-like glutamine amidotransferase
MRVHVLQHLPFEGLGSIETWLQERGAHVEFTSFYESTALPEVAGLDLIIALGGSMSVNDESRFPWLGPERHFLREGMEKGAAVLGVCLGAQLIARALGARVYPNAQKEIGWFDIEATAEKSDIFRLPPSARVFHWHGETFDLPSGAVRLAKSAACENQAFQWGRRVIGLQFHLEMTPNSLDALLTNCRNEIVKSEWIQAESTIRNVSPGDFKNLNLLMAEVLKYLADR